MEEIEELQRENARLSEQVQNLQQTVEWLKREHEQERKALKDTYKAQIRTLIAQIEGLRRNQRTEDQAKPGEANKESQLSSGEQKKQSNSTRPWKAVSVPPKVVEQLRSVRIGRKETERVPVEPRIDRKSVIEQAKVWAKELDSVKEYAKDEGSTPHVKSEENGDDTDPQPSPEEVAQSTTTAPHV